jgi:hypothetical protein
MRSTELLDGSVGRPGQLKRHVNATLLIGHAAIGLKVENKEKYNTVDIILTGVGYSVSVFDNRSTDLRCSAKTKNIC